MLGIDPELKQLYEKAEQNGEAVLKARWCAGNYGCCSTRAPLIEKYKIISNEQARALYFWGTLAVKIELNTKKVTINHSSENSNYEQKIIDWFIHTTKDLSNC